MRYSYLFATLIIITAVILAVTSVWDDSAIVDEIPHIGSGYSYVKKQDMRLNPEHPPLAKDMAGLPLLFLNIDQTIFNSRQWLSNINDQWNFGRMVIYNSGVDADLITRLAKLPMLLFFILSAILIFHWGRKLYGKQAGIFALILFAFSPTILAHSRFVTTDMPALFGVLFATYFFLRYLKTPTKNNAFIASATFGIALLTKFSTFLLIPYLGALALLWGFIHGEGFKKRLQNSLVHGLRSVLIFVIGFVIIVWPVYGFHVQNYPPSRQYSDTKNILSSFGKRYLAEPVVWASDKPIIRAAAHYGLGLLMVVQRSAGGNTTYFLGEVSRFGWRHYFPIVYFIKEPLPWWGLFILVLLFSALRTRRISIGIARTGEWIKNHFTETAMLLWLAIYWGSSIYSTLNIGVRHLIPTYPFIILLVSGKLSSTLIWLKESYTKHYRPALVIISLLFAWYVIESIRVFPYYLTYFNQMAGGPSGGHRYVVDSNLDWGQDLKRFSRWVKENNIEKIEFDYFGWADPESYMEGRRIWLTSTTYKDARDFIMRNRSNGWLAVSITFLQGSIGPEDKPEPINYLWLKSYEPVIIIGNSIFVYRITAI